MKKILSLLVGALLLTSCQGSGASPTAAGTPTAGTAEASTTAAGTTAAGTTAAGSQAAGEELILTTTTSTRDSGLLDYLLPKFKEASGIQVKVVALGTGAAIKAAEQGNADVLMVHDRVKEDQFVAEGYGLKRYDLMYNDFLLCGTQDSATVLGGEKNIVEELKLIAQKELPFVSRGDESGTHAFELRTWEKAGVTLPKGQSNWYFSIGQGMADTLNFTAEKKGFTIADRATFLATKNNTGLVEVSEPSEELINPYGIIELNPQKVTVRNPEGAKAFIQWLLSDETAQLINEFGKAEYGQQLFFSGVFKK